MKRIRLISMVVDWFKWRRKLRQLKKEDPYLYN